MTATAAQDAPRFLFYSHDSVGVGHLKRAYVLGQHLRARWPAMAQLIVTGLNRSHHFPCPEGADYVKLPSVRYVGRGRGVEGCVSHLSAVPLEDVRALRSELLLSIARHFRPDAFIVDHLPAGQGGELVATLRYLKGSSPRTRLILGLRDVMDEGPRLREIWARHGGYGLVDELYDLILVYGQPDVYDLAVEAGLSPRGAAKVRYVGYLRRQPGARSPEQIRAELGLQTDRLVLVTIGGGADGHDVLRAALDAWRRCPPNRRFDCVLVGGPLMAADERERLRALVPAHAPVRFLDYVEDLAGYVAAADAVVSRGGYNTVCEIVSFARPAVIIPRVAFGIADHTEQLTRAEALRRRGLVRMIHPADLTPSRLLEEVLDLLARPAVPAAPLDLGGLPAVVAELEQLLERSPR